MRTLHFLFIFLMIAFQIGLNSQHLKYQKPSSEILELADYDRPPSIKVDEKKQFLIYSYRKTYKSLDDLNQPEMKLAGLRINTQLHVSSSMTYNTRLQVKNLVSNSTYDASNLPENAKICYASYSPDDSRYAFCVANDSGLALFVMMPVSGICKQITPFRLNACLGIPYSWVDNDHLIVKMVPTYSKPLLNSSMEIADGPIVMASEGKVSQNRTFQDLLKTPSDEDNFESLILSELKIASVRGFVRDFLPTDKYTFASVSPDLNYVMVGKIKRPFSYLVPYSRFPTQMSIYTKSGNFVKTVNEQPLIENMPKGFNSVPEGRRNIMWKPNEAATLFFVEAIDGGDGNQKAEYREKLYTWVAPFTDSAKPIARLKQRFSAIEFGRQDIGLVSESWYDTRNTKLFKINTAIYDTNPRLVWDRNYQDKYSDPGTFVLKKNEFGFYVLSIEDDQLTLTGDGFTKNGQFPFVSSMNIDNFNISRLYTADGGKSKETILEVLNKKDRTFLVQIQSATDFPNYFIRNLSQEHLTKLTDFQSPFRALNGVKKEVIQYARKDGLPLSGTLYVPKDFKKGEKRPLLIWAYPAEYKDRKSAGQVTKNENEFTFPSYGSFIYWVNKGYVVLDDASFPIVGEDSTEPNDNFLPQLISNAEAAVDAVDKLGYIDRKRCAIGGHSYGAFMTANLLTHTKLFACGVARSGAYNRTLTPFGFQSETRNYWDAPNVYNDMSPFMTAHKMKTPMLLVHGAADNNAGTFTFQSERYFAALKGLGAPVRLVLLPFESHGYAAKENIFHLLWEQDQLFEKYLKK
jgi:dipeptidyl aminopeptidase/acylaminoacyl peptidase